MDKKTAFIGHRKVYYEGKVKERLEAAIAKQIADGCRRFVMGTHGEFDFMALSACKQARFIIKKSPSNRLPGFPFLFVFILVF